MNDAQGPKQQIVERIKDSSNILVTVNANPSVDELSAALGLTLMLNAIKKHTTAVVSGDIPPAIEFLEPGRTFENTVDSLRDFIIALDKEKADHLRYKVDGDVVKIFITPYRITLSQDDLDFSQGDYNVEMVLALGVRDESDLDKALAAHGRILHDATVATLSCGDQSSKLGSIDWHESSASSISEMLVSLSEALKGDKPLLDEQTSTAFLTGIVAATDRFSNNKTSSKVMTMAAQLMAAGANQQLIAAKLQDANEISGGQAQEDSASADLDKAAANSDGTTDLEENASMQLDRKSKKAKKSAKAGDAKPDDGTLSISHQLEGNLDEVAKQVHENNTEQATQEAEHALASQLESVVPSATAAATPSIDDLKNDLAAANADVDAAANATDLITPTGPQAPLGGEIPMPSYEPTIGGTLNATTQEAEEEKRREAMSSQNRSILSHGEAPLGNNEPTFGESQFSAATMPTPAPSETHDNGFSGTDETPPTVQAAPIMPPTPVQTLAELDQATRGTSHDDARAAVTAAFDTAPAEPTPSPFGSSLPPLEPPTFGATDTTSLGVTPPANPFQDSSSTGLPSLPDFTTLPPPPPPSPQDASVFPPQQPEQLGQILPEVPVAAPSQPADPMQFKIPGQS